MYIDKANREIPEKTPYPTPAYHISGVRCHTTPNLLSGSSEIFRTLLENGGINIVDALIGTTCTILLQLTTRWSDMMNRADREYKKEVFFRRASLEVGGGGNSQPAHSCCSRNVAQVPINETSLREVGDYCVLVINSSQDMAKEITFQLSVQIPGCSLMYAPTLQLGICILRRKHIDLIVSDAILPDGNVTRLNEALMEMETPPDLVVVGGLSATGAREFKASGYRFSEVRSKTRETSGSLASQIRKSTAQDLGVNLSQAIKGLGADIRNDLNNPLQEIVAMLFVARAHGQQSASIDLALGAIEKAAQNMAGVVRGLEDKIRSTVLQR